MAESESTMIQRIKSEIRLVQDWPKPGIAFRDISPLLINKQTFGDSVKLLAARYKDQKIDYVAGLESRGFIWAAPLAAALGAGFLMIRKPSKLPPNDKISVSYGKEYGTDVFELYTGAWDPVTGMNGASVLIVDDLLATGGSALGASQLIEQAKGTVVECVFIIELPSLNGRNFLAPRPCFSLVEFSDDDK